MSNKTFEKRKKIIYDFICDDMYVPNEVQRDGYGPAGE